ncbi:MAG: FG-GAP-like repeat-containing protein [Planctomycetota bacterium]
MSKRHVENAASKCRRRRGRLLRPSLAMLLLLPSAGCESEKQAGNPSREASAETRDEAVPDVKSSAASVVQSIEEGDFESAKAQLRQVLIEEPDSANSQWLMARLAVAEERFGDAAELLLDAEVLRNRDTLENRWLELLGDLAESSGDFAAGREAVAWSGLELVLRGQPQRHAVRRSLIRLLNGMGHRHRACQHAEWLCKAGVAGETELLSLISRRRAFPAEIEATSDSRAAVPLQALRRLYSQNRFSAALQLIPKPDGPWTHAEHAALCGEVYARAQDFESLAAWYSACPKNAERYAEFWSAIGIWLEESGSYEAAAGAYLKAIEIDPTLGEDYKRLGFCFRQLKSPGKAETAIRRGKAVQSTSAQVSLAAIKDADSARYYAVLSKTLNDLGRPFEFIAWQLFLSRTEGSPPGYVRRLEQQRTRLVGVADFAAMSALDQRMNFSAEDFPPPKSKELQELAPSLEVDATLASEASASTTTSDQEIAFVDVAASVGLDFQYRNHPDPKEIDMRIHESLGGGVGVLDFDLDGRPDVIFNQAGGNPPDVASHFSNQLYRNVASRFVEVTQLARTEDRGYSTGVACGDVNQDGFPDFFVGSLGRNRLFVNQGDGSFREAELNAIDDRFTGSVAIADISGDRLPDLVATNYVDDENIFEIASRPEGTPPAGTSPLDHRAAKDRVHFCLPDGSHRTLDLETRNGGAAPALGVLITDLDSNPGNEIFIANDATPNRLWIQDPSGELGFSEQSVVSGVAVDASRAEAACMGIASGDFDDNGRIDLHVANFWREFSSLYMQQSEGVFRDLAPRFKLDAATYAMLGFGTQAQDINRDGILDLMILNGHIEDYSMLGHSFRMPAQVLLGSRRMFREPLDSCGEYFDTPRLGRSLVYLDWNSDGRMDFIAGHLASPAALLENRTPYDTRAIQIELVGTRCERDAIGSHVRLDLGNRSTHAWLTAGDGYFGSNERVIEFAMTGDAFQSLSITWPDGTQKTFSELPEGYRFLVIQGQGVQAR